MHADASQAAPHAHAHKAMQGSMKKKSCAVCAAKQNETLVTSRLAKHKKHHNQRVMLIQRW
jgi:hypothetical protein